MSQRNETAVLVLTLLLVAGLVAGGFWWLTKKSEKQSAVLTGCQPSPSCGASSSSFTS